MFPISANQEWLAQCSINDRSMDNVIASFNLASKPDHGRLQEAIHITEQRHPLLTKRINFSGKSGFHESISNCVIPFTSSSIDSNELDLSYEKSLQNSAIDLAKTPLCEIFLITSRQCRLIIKLNHLICDPNSCAILLASLDQAYQNPAIQPQPCSIFEQYVQEEHTIRSSTDYVNQRDAAKMALEGIMLIHPKADDQHCHVLLQRIPSVVIKALQNKCIEFKCSKWIAAYAYFAYSVNRLFPDLPKRYGMNVTARTKRHLRNVIAPLSEQQIIKDLECIKDPALACQQIRSFVFDLYQGQKPKIIDIVDNPSQAFNILFDYQQYQDTSLQFNNETIEQNIMPSPSKMRRWISAKLIEKKGAHYLHIRYRNNLFTETMMQNLAQIFSSSITG